MKRSLIAAAITLAMLLTIFPGMAAASDIEGHWAQNTMKVWSDKGWFIGDGAGTYRPDTSITRAEFMRLVNQMKGYSTTADEQVAAYTDVSMDKWYYTDVSKALAAGYITGLSINEMAPERNITRQEAVTIVARIANINASANLNLLTNFSDNDAIGQWAQGYMAAAIGEGFVKGYAGQVNPVDNITRAETVTLLDGVYANVRTYNYAGTYGGNSTDRQNVDGVVIATRDVILNYTDVATMEIASGVGDGDATLNNVKVTGTLNINGGGSESVNINNSELGTVVLNYSRVHVNFNNTTVRNLSTLRPANITADPTSNLGTLDPQADVYINGELTEGTGSDETEDSNDETGDSVTEGTSSSTTSSSSGSGSSGSGGGGSSTNYTVTFNVADGDSILSQSVRSGGKINWDNAVPTHDEYEFGAWYTGYTDDAYTEIFNPDSTISKHMTLYARWLIGDEDYVEIARDTFVLEGKNVIATLEVQGGENATSEAKKAMLKEYCNEFLAGKGLESVTAEVLTEEDFGDAPIPAIPTNGTGTDAEIYYVEFNKGDAEALTIIAVNGFTGMEQQISDLAVATKTDTTVTLTWTAATEATSVVLHVSLDGDSYEPVNTDDLTDINIPAELDELSTEVIVSGLELGSDYSFKLVITGGPYEGDSNMVDVTTEAAASSPSPPVISDEVVATATLTEDDTDVDVYTLTLTGSLLRVNNIFAASPTISSDFFSVLDEEGRPLASLENGQFTIYALDLNEAIQSRGDFDNDSVITIEQTNPALSLIYPGEFGSGAKTSSTTLANIIAEPFTFLVVDSTIDDGAGATIVVKESGNILFTINVDNTGFSIEGAEEAIVIG